MREEFTFRLILDGAELTTKILGQLLDLGCEDAMFGEEQGVKVADFDRSALSFETAVLSAITAVEATTVLTVVRVEPDELVTASGIAERTGRTRQSISQLIAGQRGTGGFPPPLSTADGKTRIWRWTDVRAWFARSTDEPAPNARRAHFIAAMNGALDVRRHSDRFSASGGSPGMLEAIHALAAGRDDWQRAQSMLTPAEEPAETVWCSTRHSDGSTYSSVLRETVRRTQSHLVFLSTALVSDLSQALELKNPELAGWLKDATSAHDRAVQYRLAGDLRTALTHDHQVAECTMRILRYDHHVGGRARRLSLDWIDPDCSWRSERSGLIGKTFHSQPKATSTPSSLDDILAMVKNGDRRTVREPQSLCQVVDALKCDHAAELTMIHGPSAEQIELAELIGPELAPWGYGTIEALTYTDHPGYRGPADRADNFELAFAYVGPDALEDSVRLLLLSSWALACTVNLLVEEHLPNRAGLVGDALARIEEDLASRSS